jgi:hypothetical protein
MGIRIQAIPLPLMSPSENHPPVECCRPMFAASAGLYPKIGGRSLDRIAKPDILVGDKSRQAHPMWRVFALVWRVIAFVCLCHEFTSSHLLLTGFGRPLQRPAMGELPRLAAV